MFQPSLFLSHGAPDLSLQTEHPTYRFLQELPQMFPRPDAVVMFSAHWGTDHVQISKDSAYRAIYDFSGFDDRLYALRYAPKGSPDLAQMVLDLVQRPARQAELVNNENLDHGAWVPLRLMYPDPFMPLVQVAIQPQEAPEYHYALGQSLAELRDHNVLIIGSGSITHNLYEMNWSDYNSPPPEWVTAFTDWMRDRLEAGDYSSVLQYRSLAPYAKENHPSEEHLLPLFIAMGAGGTTAQRIHTASSYGTVMMDAYAFT